LHAFLGRPMKRHANRPPIPSRRRALPCRRLVKRLQHRSQQGSLRARSSDGTRRGRSAASSRILADRVCGRLHCRAGDAATFYPRRAYYAVSARCLLRCGGETWTAHRHAARGHSDRTMGADYHAERAHARRNGGAATLVINSEIASSEPVFQAVARYPKYTTTVVVAPLNRSLPCRRQGSRRRAGEPRDGLGLHEVQLRLRRAGEAGNQRPPWRSRARLREGLGLAGEEQGRPLKRG